MSAAEESPTHKFIKLLWITEGRLQSGQINVMAITHYFGGHIRLSEVDELACSMEYPSCAAPFLVSQGIARAAALLGMDVELCTTSLEMNRSNFALELYHRYSPGIEAMSRTVSYLVEECRRLKAHLREESINLDEILSRISETEIPLVLMDFSRLFVTPVKGYYGVYASIVGADEQNVYIYNNTPDSPSACYPVPRKMFEAARKSAGTDEDVIFIRKGSLNNLLPFKR